MSDQKRPSEVETWHIEPGIGLVINGEPLPYYVLAEGPMVEQMPGHEDAHILWLPLIARGAAPRAGRPNGEPASNPHAHPEPRERQQDAQ